MANLDDALEILLKTVETHKGCQKEISNLNDTKEKLQKEMVECTNNTVQMRNELEKKFQDFKVMSGNILKEELAEHKNKANKLCEALLKKNHQSKMDFEELEKELVKLRSENIELTTKIGCFDNKNQNEIKQITLLEKQNAVCNERIENISNQLARLEDEHKNLKEQLVTLTGENENLKEQFDQLENKNKQRFDRLEDDNRFMKERLLKIEQKMLLNE